MDFLSIICRDRHTRQLVWKLNMHVWASRDKIRFCRACREPSHTNQFFPNHPTLADKKNLPAIKSASLRRAKTGGN